MKARLIARCCLAFCLFVSRGLPSEGGYRVGGEGASPGAATPETELASRKSKDPSNSRIEIIIIDRISRQPIPCRVHLKNQSGQPVFAAGMPRRRDHFVCPGKVDLELPDGKYSYEIERGPEYIRSTGSFALSGEVRRTIEAKLNRLADLAEEGWWSGDLHVHRPVKDIQLLMQAEDLHVAPVITSEPRRGSFWIGPANRPSA